MVCYEASELIFTRLFDLCIIKSSYKATFLKPCFLRGLEEAQYNIMGRDKALTVFLDVVY